MKYVTDPPTAAGPQPAPGAPAGGAAHTSGGRGGALAVLLALVGGIAIGALLESNAGEAVVKSVARVEMVGTIWINAIRMTVIPLVAALTITAVATSGDAGQLGKLGGVSIAVFLGLLLMGGFVTMLLTPLSFQFLDIAPDVAARLRESMATPAGGSGAAMPSLSQRIVDMVPVNPIKAAADGAILPVVVFALALGFALTRLDAEKRAPLIEVCRALSDGLLVLVQWVLSLAPIGVFALAVALGIRMGASSAGALAHYIVTLCAALFVVVLLLYGVVAIAARMSPRRFASAALPAQAVGFSSRSSLAALPAMVAAVGETLSLGPRASGFALPLAVSLFRINVPIAWVVGLAFLGKLYGVEMDTGAMVMLVFTATLLSFSVPGLPSASLFLLSPVLVQNGIPAEGVGILIALDAIPDMFKTLANVTGHLASAAIVARVDATSLSRGARPG